MINENQSSPKAIFLSGPSGSGKSTITRDLLPSDWEIINIDIEYEKLLKQSGLGTDIKDFEQKELSKSAQLMSKARKSTETTFNQFSNDGKNIIIDGTGASSKSLLNKKSQLESLGYNTFMIMVWSTPYTALERNQNRERSLKPFIILRTWRDVIKNIEIYRNEFKDKFILLNNDPNGKMEFNYEYVKNQFPSQPSGKQYTPEETAKLAKDKEELHSDINNLLSSIPQFDSIDDAKFKIEQFTKENLNEIKLIPQNRILLKKFIEDDWLHFELKGQHLQVEESELERGYVSFGEWYINLDDLSEFLDSKNIKYEKEIDDDGNNILKIDAKYFITPYKLNEIKKVQVSRDIQQILDITNAIGKLLVDNEKLLVDKNDKINKLSLSILNRFVNSFNINYHLPSTNIVWHRLNILDRDVKSFQIAEFFKQFPLKIQKETLEKLNKVYDDLSSQIQADQENNLNEIQIISQPFINKLIKLIEEIENKIDELYTEPNSWSKIYHEFRDIPNKYGFITFTRRILNNDFHKVLSKQQIQDLYNELLEFKNTYFPENKLDEVRLIPQDKYNQILDLNHKIRSILNHKFTDDYYDSWTDDYRDEIILKYFNNGFITREDLKNLDSSKFGSLLKELEEFYNRLNKFHISYQEDEEIEESLFTKEFWKENLFEVKLIPAKKVNKIIDIYNKIPHYYREEKDDIWSKYPENWGDFTKEDFDNIYNDFTNLYNTTKTNDRTQEDSKYDLSESKINKKQIIKEFLKYCIKELDLKENCKIILTSDKSKTTTYAHYNPQDNEIVVYIKNRSLGDILRSICHELVHAKQKQNGELKPNSGDTGSEQENEANSKAGIILRDFGKQYPQIFESKKSNKQILSEIKLIPQNRILLQKDKDDLHIYYFQINDEKYYIFEYEIIDNNNIKIFNSNNNNNLENFFNSKKIPYTIVNNKTLNVDTKYFITPDKLNEIKLLKNPTLPLLDISKIKNINDLINYEREHILSWWKLDKFFPENFPKNLKHQITQKYYKTNKEIIKDLTPDFLEKMYNEYHDERLEFDGRIGSPLRNKKYSIDNNESKYPIILNKFPDFVNKFKIKNVLNTSCYRWDNNYKIDKYIIQLYYCGNIPILYIILNGDKGEFYTPNGYITFSNLNNSIKSGNLELVEEALELNKQLNEIKLVNNKLFNDTKNIIKDIHSKIDIFDKSLEDILQKYNFWDGDFKLKNMPYKQMKSFYNELVVVNNNLDKKIKDKQINPKPFKIFTKSWWKNIIK
jgi:predicted kinase